MMNDLNGKYIITLNVDGRDWTSRPIVSSLDQAIKEAKEQLKSYELVEIEDIFKAQSIKFLFGIKHLALMKFPLCRMLVISIIMT